MKGLISANIVKNLLFMLVNAMNMKLPIKVSSLMNANIVRKRLPVEKGVSHMKGFTLVKSLTSANIVTKLLLKKVPALDMK